MSSSAARAAEEEAAAFAREIRRRQRRIVKHQGIIAQKRQEVFDLKARQQAATVKYFSARRLDTWRHQYNSKKASQQTLRPSDQTLTLRNYTRMDLDLWERDELRHWFAKHAKSDQYGLGFGYDKGPADQSYLEERAPPAPVPRRPPPEAARKPRRQRFVEPLAPERMPAAGTLPDTVVCAADAERQGPHFLDFEGNLQQQRAQADAGRAGAVARVAAAPWS